MDERLKFIAGLLDGEKMAALCRRFGISRKTGYKMLDRYNNCGVEPHVTMSVTRGAANFTVASADFRV
jgi:transposase